MKITVNNGTYQSFRFWDDAVGYAVGDGKGRWYLVARCRHRHNFVQLVKLNSISGETPVPAVSPYTHAVGEFLPLWVVVVGEIEIVINEEARS